MPRKSRKSGDPVRAAASVFALTAATDEEFAAGIPFKNPGVILSGKRPAKKKPAKKR